MLKKSALLEYLMDRAEKLKEKDGKKSVSANYFFVSLLQVMWDRSHNELPDNINDEISLKELDEVNSLIGKYNFNLEKSLDGILMSVHDAGYVSYMDEIVFGKINYSAEAKTKQLNREVIDAYVFVLLILDEPTAAIKKYIMDKAPAAEDIPADIPIGRPASAASEAVSEPEPESETEDGTDAFEEMLKILRERHRAAKEASGKEEADLGIKRLAKTVESTKRIQNLLLDSVFGQDQAINSFVSGYFQAELMAHSRKGTTKPQATFLFAGPPGVGKTFLAEKAAEALELPFMRFDMSEYSDKEANLEFCGSDKVYKNGQPGNVTSFVAGNPHCVLLFDEIEKAHINIIHLFLQILDAGRIRDNYTDEEVSFSNSVIIFTTNAGKNLYSDTSVSNLSSLPRKKILRALATDVNPETNIPLFPAAICSRFASGNVVMFNHLGASNLFTIARRELQNNITGFARSTGINIQIDDKVPTAIILSEGGKADARTVKGRSNSFFHEELYELFRLLATDAGVVEKLKTIKVNVSIGSGDPEISKMFINPSKPEVLIFAAPERVETVIAPLNNVVFHVTDKIDEAKEILFNNDISVILCDVFCNPRSEEKDLLNVEDITSDGRDFLMYAVSRYSIPVDLLQGENGEISREEFLSFAKLGVQNIISLKAGKKNSFEKQVLEKCKIAYQQGNMLKLARENKIISYKTSQTISRNKKTAEITLFDFKLSLATDVDDSKNILDNVSKPNIHFADVIGAEDAKRELTYFVEYLKDPVKYIRKGVRAPKGVLLYGPPGTGKTMLAKAMAGESDVTFLTAEGNQFLKRYVGEGSESVHELFASARKYAPSILFIDEIDAIGKDRNSTAANDATGDVLTAFLTEMDGFNTDTTKPVFVLAATNYEVEQGKGKSLDPALLRRFDRRIYVDLPTKEERKRFLYMKASNGKMISLSDEQIENIAVRSTGMSLAELDSVYEMALRNAICSEGCIVDDDAFEEAFETFNGGEKKQWSRDTLERTARHEAGHALLCWLAGEKPSYLTIVARGDHGGYMQHSDGENKGLFTKAELIEKIRTSLAGRAAEIVYYGQEEGISTGASGDLYSATNIAEQMICKYGMDEEIGLSYLSDNDKSSLYYNEIRKRTNEILSFELKNTIALILENRRAIDKMVEALLEKNHLKENEIDAIFKATVN